MGENPAALRAAVFSLSSKNPRGGGVQTPPPSRARVNTHHNSSKMRLARYPLPPQVDKGLEISIMQSVWRDVPPETSFARVRI